MTRFLVLNESECALISKALSEYVDPGESDQKLIAGLLWDLA